MYSPVGWLRSMGWLMWDVKRRRAQWRSGNKEALDRLVPVVYDELRILASRQLAHEWRHNRLDTTAVVNEAYLKLFGQREVDWQNRGHFFAIAAQLMRRISSTTHGAIFATSTAVPRSTSR